MSPNVLLPTERVLHVCKSVDQAGDAGDGIADLAAHVTETVGELVGARGQSVEVSRALSDRDGCVAESAANLARLIGRLGLIERFPRWVE